MNCGIGGNGIPEYLALIHDAVPLFRPRRLIVVLYANDLPLTDGVPPRKSLPLQRSSAWEPRLLQILARAARHEPVPRRWHSPPVLFVPVVPDPLNPWSNPPPEFSRVDPALAEAMRKGDFNPFVVDVLNKAATALREPVEMSETLRQLQTFARGQGTELRLVYLPFSTQVSDRYVPFQQKYDTHGGVRLAARSGLSDSPGIAPPQLRGAGDSFSRPDAVPSRGGGERRASVLGLRRAHARCRLT